MVCLSAQSDEKGRRAKRQQVRQCGHPYDFVDRLTLLCEYLRNEVTRIHQHGKSQTHVYRYKTDLIVVFKY